MTLLSKTNGLPLYHQLTEILRQKIVTQEICPGERLPSESELSRTYQVSRITARQALKELAGEGLINRVPGSGSYVSLKKLKRQLNQLGGFTEDLQVHGLDIKRSILECKLDNPPNDIRSKLSLGHGELAVIAKRLIFVEQEPIAILKSYLPEHLARELITADLEHKGIYELLQKTLGLKLGHAEQVLEIGRANAEEALQLTISSGAPVFRTKRNTYLADGDPVEVADAVFRGDRVQFYTRLVAHQE